MHGAVGRLRRFAALSRDDRRLTLQAAGALAMARARLRINDAARWRGGPQRRRSRAATPHQIVAAVERATRIIPGATCLVRAIALQRLLSRHGHESSLAIGVGRWDGRFSAHAWVAQRGRILIGACPELARYRIIATWSTGAPSLAPDPPPAAPT